MSERTLAILFFLGAAVMGASLFLWYRDKRTERPIREHLHSLLTAIALLLMYPGGGYQFWSLVDTLLPGGELWMLLWFSFISGLVVLGCSVWFYLSNRKYGHPIRQRHYAIAIVIGLLLTWHIGFLFSVFCFSPFQSLLG